MTPERWKQVKQALHSILELPADEREVRLAQLDEGTRGEVASLLAAAAGTGHDQFLEPPPVASAHDEEIGRRIGPWRIVEELGRGGMGAVYRAARDDDELEGEVALKVIKRGMDTDVVLRRFRAERQILSGLSHPHIARLLDAGSTEDGTPWFAMELVRGEPIDRYCERDALGVRARLELFLGVCSAVHHAHQNLIVHRDIKPSNILVTAEGRPVLLDFGIAKLLDAEANATATEHAIMTPAYASPEQLTGAQITTASDVYSLGVLLYELLVGRRPYPASTPHAIQRAIAHEEVVLPSVAITRAGGDPRRARQVRGDLDAIVALAMRGEPGQRYASARELAQDIAAYLAGMPTVARREGIVGRTWKLVRRHRAAAVAITAIVVTLIGGVVATVRQARIAEAERARAERRFDEVRHLATRLLYDLHETISGLPGATAARVLLVEESKKYLEGLARDASGRPDLLLDLSEAWHRLGDAQGNAANANLGDIAGARDSYLRAVAAAEEASALDPQSVRARVYVAWAHDGLGDLKWQEGDLAGAAGEFERSIALMRQVVAEHPQEPEARFQLASSLADLADCFDASEPERKLTLYREAHALFEGLIGQLPDHRVLAPLSTLLNKLAHLAVARGEREDALESYRKALAMREGLLARSPTSAARRRDVSTSLEHIAKILRADGDHAGARAALERALELCQAIFGADPQDVRALRDVAVATMKLAEIDLDAAVDSTVTADQIAYLRAARAGFRRALDDWLVLETRGGFAAGDEALAGQLRGAITMIEKALAGEGHTSD